jgi:hypothetical protein
MVSMTTAGTNRHLLRRRRIDAAALMSNVGHFGLGSVGVLLIGISAWGAIVPFVGPSFGYAADGASSWHWSLTHVVVALLPGAVAILFGMVVLGRSRGLVASRGRFSLATSGLVVMACGAWFAIAPWAWPVVDSTRAYFVGASPLRTLANLSGYALGPGLLVMACGAFFVGWAIRHQDTGSSIVNDQTFAAPPPAVERPTVIEGG